jgi:hypothetical protein
MEPLGQLIGTLLDDDNLPMSGVQVRLYKSGTDLYATTNASGQFVFSNLALGTYSISASADNHQNLSSSSVIIVSGDNTRIFTMNIIAPFSFDDGNGIFIPADGAHAMMALFECNNTSLPGTTTTRTLRIKNNRQQSLSWSMTNLPSYGITFSLSSGTVAANGTVTITTTFTFPTNTGTQTGRTQLSLTGCTGYSKTYVWNWEEKGAGLYGWSGQWIQDACTAACVQTPIINVGTNSEAFDILFNQFIVWQ